MMKKLLLLSLFLLPHLTLAKSVSDKTILWVLDTESACGKISMERPEWITEFGAAYQGGWFAIPLRLFSGLPQEKFFVNFSCYDITSPNVFHGYAIYNLKNQLWELNPDVLEEDADEENLEDLKNRVAIHQLEAVNGSGWLTTWKNFCSGPHCRVALKSMSFCLIHPDEKKALCGISDDTQFLDLDGNMHDFEPMVTRFIETIRFIDTEK